MKFLSVDKSPEYVIVPGRYKTVQTAVGAVAQPVRGKRVKFHALSEPLPTTLLPAKMGVQAARGMLDTKVEAERIGIDEEVLIEFLREHEDYGLHFVGVDPQGEAAAEEEVDPIENLGGGDGYFCKLCDAHLSTPQAVAGHTRSGQHQDNVKAARKRAAERLEAITSEKTEESDEALAVAMAQAEKRNKAGEDPGIVTTSG